MLTDQQNLFDVPNDVAYLNTAYIGPRLRAVTEAGKHAIDASAMPWTVTAADFFDPVDRLRETVGSMLGDDAEGIAIIPSISYGIGVAAANLVVGEGRTVVLLREQFPSNVYPWRAKVANDGGDIITVDRSEDGWTAAILGAINDRTAIVAVPNSHWTDGSRVELKVVGEAARSVGAALVVDASQSFGAMPLDVHVVQPDFVATVGYKWQLGSYGVGYLWVAEHHRTGIPLEEGWAARKDAADFAGLVDYTDSYEFGARRFDVGERSNFIGIAMANAAMDQVASWGVPAIAETLGTFTAEIVDGARQHGWLIAPAEQRSPHLIGLRYPGGVPEDVIQALGEANVSVSIRGDSIRVSPHLHTTQENVDRLLSVLRTV